MRATKQRRAHRGGVEDAGSGGLATTTEASPVSFLEDDGVLLLHNPELFRPGREAFCRRLADALVRQEGVRSVRISQESGTCRIDFEPGRVDEAGMAERFARAVRSAIDQETHDGRADGSAAGWTTLAVFSTGDGRSVWEVLDEGPGSIRLRNPLLRRDRSLARRVARTIRDLPGITASRATFWSHDLDLRFDPTVSNADAVIGAAEGTMRRILRPEPAGPVADGAEEPGVARGLKRVWYLALAGGSFGMTLVGFLVPGIPTVPFLLATSYYLARSSPRLNRLLRRSWFFGPILEDYQTYGGLRPISRIKLIGLTLTLGLVMLVLIGPPFLVLVAMVGAITASLYLIMRIPGIPKRVRGRRRSQPALAGAPVLIGPGSRHGDPAGPGAAPAGPARRGRHSGVTAR